MTFGKRLRAARLAKGYTQAQLGEMVDVSDAAVRMWESDRREPDIGRIRLLHDLWFKGQPLTYAEKLAARQAIELPRTAMQASEGEGEDRK